MSDTRAEQETGFRWDNEQRRLEAWTADGRVAGRWRKAGYEVRVLGKCQDGSERTWDVVVPWPADGTRRPWIRLFTAAIPDFSLPGDPEGLVEADGDAP